MSERELLRKTRESLGSTSHKLDQNDLDKLLSCPNEEFTEFISRLEARVRMLEMKKQIATDYQCQVQQEFDIVKQVHWMFQLPCTTCSLYTRCVCTKVERTFSTLCADSVETVSSKKSRLQVTKSLKPSNKRMTRSNEMNRPITRSILCMKIVRWAESTLRRCSTARALGGIGCEGDDSSVPIAHPNILTVVRQEIDITVRPPQRFFTVQPLFDA